MYNDTCSLFCAIKKSTDAKTEKRTTQQISASNCLHGQHCTTCIFLIVPTIHMYGGWLCENTTPDDYSEFDSSESCADVTCSSVPSSVAASWRTSLLSTRASISTQATMSPGTRLWFRCPQFKRSVVRTRHYVLIVRRNVDTHDLALVPGQCL